MTRRKSPNLTNMHPVRNVMRVIHPNPPIIELRSQDVNVRTYVKTDTLTSGRTDTGKDVKTQKLIPIYVPFSITTTIRFPCPTPFGTSLGHFRKLQQTSDVCKADGLNVEALAVKSEPACSKFDYELKTLEAMLRIEQRVEKMASEVKVLKHEVSKELVESKELRSTMQRDFDRLNSNIASEIETAKIEIENKKAEIQDQIEALTRKYEHENKQGSNTDGPTIAFTVTNPTQNLVNGVPTFSVVVTNIGGGYDTDTGVFTSPVDGLYSFMFTLASMGSHDVYCWIRHNDNKKVFARSYSDNSYTTASTSVLLQLTIGDRVNIGSNYIS